MPKPKKGPRLGGSPSHQKAILSNLAKDVILRERITTTKTRAKLARPVVDRLITYGKNNTVHSRREAMKLVNDRMVIRKLFDEIAPRYSGREGGYTRTIKLGRRQGDGADMVILELV